ncbi:hypothetical protein SRB17_83490 [Streptomyces sp. RB17]|nr:hypothetical protein [Streptomyces sp. RB17]
MAGGGPVGILIALVARTADNAVGRLIEDLTLQGGVDTSPIRWTPDDGIDWDTVFSTGPRWLHTGGIFAGLSDTTIDVADEAMAAARRHGVTVSYDPNHSPRLWAGRGGPDRARETEPAPRPARRRRRRCPGPDRTRGHSTSPPTK